jgi:single-stranded-DNA-specific exonuclease
MSSIPASISDNEQVAETFKHALLGFHRTAPTLVVSHNDTDGLSAAAILWRALSAAGYTVRVCILRRGETPWSPEVGRAIVAAAPGGLIVADLGTRAGQIAPGVPTVVLDHHIPRGEPPHTTVIQGLRYNPAPTTSLLAWWAVSALADASPWLWLAAIGLVGDMAEKSGFSEMEEARRRYGITTLRNAASLVNAPRRTASGDCTPALALLMNADGPQAITSGSSIEALALRAAKEEVKLALQAGKRVGPKVRNGVALVRYDTPCQIHPLLAQTWRGRLKNEIVLAANAGYRKGWVHFAARTTRDIDLTAYLAERAPLGADENYGSGHAGASGGALRLADWNSFIAGLGFGPEDQVIV